MPKERFLPGRIKFTPAAQECFLQAAGDDPLALLALVDEFVRRHIHGDWGEVNAEDRRENEFSVIHGFRIMSVYTLSTGVRFWIITEADRSLTTIQLPADY